MTFQEFIRINSNGSQTLVLRHDVDRKPGNALKLAELENQMGISGSYYFRVGKYTFNEDIIRRIARLRHEVGYHYENVAYVAKESGFRSQKFEGRRKNIEERKFEARNSKMGKNVRSQKEEERKKKVEDRIEKTDLENIIFERAIEDFKKNLEKLREFYPVKTIAMHGSPWSKWDNRKLWEKYDYRDFGIIGEPYFDVDFRKVLYLTDTGRRWDGEKFNVRDKVIGEPGARSQETGEERQNIEDRRKKIEERKFETRSTKFETNSNDQNSNEENIFSNTDTITNTGDLDSGFRGLGVVKKNTSSTTTTTTNTGNLDSGFRGLGVVKQPNTQNLILKTQYSFHSTFDIIRAAEEGKLPDQIMLNIHPQRWNDKVVPWVWEWVSQNMKNVVKRWFFVRD